MTPRVFEKYTKSEIRQMIKEGKLKSTDAGFEDIFNEEQLKFLRGLKGSEDNARLKHKEMNTERTRLRNRSYVVWVILFTLFALFRLIIN